MSARSLQALLLLLPLALAAHAAPPRASAQAGGVTVEADGVTELGGGLRLFSGHVTINDLVRLDGDARIDTKLDQVSVGGPATVFLDPQQARFETWDARGSLVIAAGRGTASTPLAWKIGGLDFTLDALDFLADQLKAQGRIALPKALGGALLPLKDVRLGTNGMAVGQTITAPKIPLKSGYKLGDSTITYDGLRDLWVGQTALEIPGGLDVVATLGLGQSGLEMVGVGVDDLNKLIYAAPPIVLQKIHGELEHFQPGPPEVRLRALVRFTAGPQTTFSGNKYFPAAGEVKALVDGAGRIGASGSLKLVSDKFELAQATIIADRAYGLYVEGRLVLTGVLDLDGRARLARSGDFTGNLQGRITIPQNLKFIGGMDLLHAWGFLNDHELLAGIKVAFINFAFSIDQGGSFHLRSGIKNPSRLVIQPPPNRVILVPGHPMDRGPHGRQRALALAWLLMPLPAQTAPTAAPVLEKREFEVGAGLDYAIFRMEWTGPGAGDFRLQRPDGTWLEPEKADPAAGGYFRPGDVRRECWLAVQSPAAGRWQMELRQPLTDLGTVTLERYESDAAPVVQLGAPVLDPTTGAYELTYSAKDPDGPAPRVTMFYDDDEQPGDGLTIASGLDPALGRYTWKTDDVPTGRWLLGARVDDGAHLPVYAYAPGTVTVVHPGAPAAPVSFGAEVAPDGRVHAVWQAPLAPSALAGLRIYYSDHAGSAGNERELLADAVPGRWPLPALEAGRTWRLEAALVSADGWEGPRSRPALVRVPGAANLAPLLTGRLPRYARVGQAWTPRVLAADPEGAAMVYDLLEGPAGLSLGAADGRLAWTPAAAQLGRQRLTIRLRDTLGAETVLRHELWVERREDGPRAPELLSEPGGEVKAGQLANWRLEALDPDGDALRYDLLEAPAGLTVSATGEVAWTPAASDAGLHPVAIAVTDARGERAVQRFDVIVAKP